MKDRVKFLRDEMNEWKDTVCTERAKIFTDVYKQNESDPLVIKRAKGLKTVLEQMPIYIRDGDMIVGTPTSKPGAWISYPEFSMGTESIVQERHNIHVGPDFIRNGLPKEVVEYWNTRNLYAYYKSYYKEVFGKEAEEKESWYRIATGLGHITPDFKDVLANGLRGFINQADERLKKIRQTDPEGAEFLRAVILVMEGGITFANRYADLCEEEAKDTQDTERKNELTIMAQGLRRIFTSGATTFHEALQSVWLCHQIMAIEGYAWSMSPGRVDQFLYPYFQNDLKKGILTEENAYELIECFLLKFVENSVFGIRGNLTQCITLGGRTADGIDMTNELSFLFLKATSDLGIPEPDVHVRWHKNISEEFMNSCLDCLAAGTGMPMFLNDEATPEGFIKLGIPPVDAFEYTHVGCGEIGIGGKLQDSALGCNPGNIENLLNILSREKTNGDSLDKLYPTFDALLAALETEMRANTEWSATITNIIGMLQKRYGQSPFSSAHMNGCIERARDLSVRADYNLPNSNLGGGGLPNLINSLAAIRQVVYREKNITLKQLVEAMEKDFQGFEEIHALLSKAPKYGNDDPNVDDLITTIESIHTSCIKDLKGPRNNGKYIATSINAQSHVMKGMITGSTPDGRLAHRPMASALSAAPGTDRGGLTAFLNTVAKLDSIGHWAGGYIANLNIMPDFFATKESRTKLMAILRTFFTRKGLNLQINCVSRKILQEAQQHPDEYKGLMVRVSGYNDYFTMLDPSIQEEIMSRSEQAV